MHKNILKKCRRKKIINLSRKNRSLLFKTIITKKTKRTIATKETSIHLSGKDKVKKSQPSKIFRTISLKEDKRRTAKQEDSTKNQKDTNPQSKVKSLEKILTARQLLSVVLQAENP